jgi:hypothetical protein
LIPLTASSCPINVRIHSKVFKSNNLIVKSCEQVTNLSFDTNSIFFTNDVWAWIVFKHLPVSISHIFIEPDLSPHINILSCTFLIHVTA